MSSICVFIATIAALQVGTFNNSWISALLIYPVGIITTIIIGNYTIDLVKDRNDELSESEKKYRHLFENSLNMIAVVDSKGIILDLNKNYLNYFGFKLGNLIGKDFRKLGSKIISKETLDIYKEKFELLLKEGFLEFQMQWYDKNNEKKWVYLQGSVIIIEGRKHILIVFQDINERREIEQKLTESEEKFRKIIENAKIGYYEIDLFGNFTFVNDTICNWFKYTRAELIGMNYKAFTSENDIDNTDKTFIDVYKTDKKVKNFEYQVITKDGSKIYGITSINLRRDSEGKKIGFSGFMSDVTERKKTEIKLKESEDNYRNAYERENFYKDLFTHDMSNILQTMLSSLEIFEFKDKFTEISSISNDILKIYNDQVNRAVDLVKNVRKFSDLDKSQIILKSVDFRSIINKAYNIVCNHREDKKINLRLDFSSDIFIVKADDFFLDVIENLLYNSVKHNENEEVEILIKSSIIHKEKHQFLKLEFIDNGRGIPDARKKSIFLRSINDNTSISGIGLGLSLVKKILDNYKAIIYVENKIHEDYSKGSNFILIFPLVSKYFSLRE